MAEAPYRFQQHGPSQAYYYQQHHQNNPQRHIARNGSPVRSSTGAFSSDTPSPSRSPASHAAYGYPYSQNQGPIMVNSGGPHQKFAQLGRPNKLQSQSHQQYSHNQPASHGSNHLHSHSATQMNAMSNFTPRNLHNGNINHSHPTLGENSPAHWHHQLQLYTESKQVQQNPHHHCKKDGVISKVIVAADSSRSEERKLEGEEERYGAVAAVSKAQRQDWDSLDCSGQGIKFLSRSLFSHYTFLKKLFLDHNCLIYLDPMIGHLRTLDHLDISNNKIRRIPEEIGMLVNLKVLLMFDNHLQSLPPEIGNLFRLEMLGIEGNPIDGPDKDFLMNNGTRALVTQFREEAPIADPPLARDWLQLDSPVGAENITVVSYNILGRQYATTSHYGYTAPKNLSWAYRKEMILDEIKGYDADVVCLQEVDRESFETFFRRELAISNYRGVFWPRSRAKTMIEKEAKLVDGCAIFFKSSKFLCLDRQLIDFGSIAINRPDMKGEHDTFNRVMPRDHIAVIVFLENRMTGSRVMVANAHIYWHPAYVDVKLVQVAILMEQISMYAERWVKHPPSTDKAPFRHSEVDDEKMSEGGEEAAVDPEPSLEYASGSQIPLVICGDFNAAEGSAVYDLIASGHIPGDHDDLAGRGYGKFTRDGIRHPFKLKSAYAAIGELRFTNYTPDFEGVLDYIWYSSNTMQIQRLLGGVDENYLRTVPGFPNHHFPSDHLALKAELSIKAQNISRSLEVENDD